MNYQGGAFTANLFGKGIDLFEAGKPVVVNELDDSINGTGLANICFNGTNCSAYNAGDVEIENSTPFTEPNVPKSFNIIIKNVVVPAQAQWVDTHQMCR